jgi:hypothetical protein
MKLMAIHPNPTAAQLATFPAYKQKWQEIILSTQVIDFDRASAVVQRTYAFLRYPEPTIHRVSNPYTGWENIPRIRKRGDPIGRYNCLPPISKREAIMNQQQSGESALFQIDHIKALLSLTFSNESLDVLYCRASRQAQFTPEANLYRSAVASIWGMIPQHRRPSAILPGEWCFSGSAGDAAWFDFCITELKVEHDHDLWNLYQDIAIHCGWLFAYEHACILCDRPTKIALDSQNRLHAIGEPAIKYADGAEFYFYQGIALPDYMAAVHPNDWQAEWILTERNAERRRVLIQGVGYDKICTELNATELDHWEDYTLLEIQDPVDVEPIHLLKMTCPSTGHIHAVRVPPTDRTARAALLWMNWGITEFAQET